MDATLKVPVPLKTEDASDVIDLDKYKSVKEIVHEWDLKVQENIKQYFIADSERSLDVLMKWYLETLKEEFGSLVDYELLKTCMNKHIYFFKLYFIELNCCFVDNYLDNMEDILAYYINTEMKLLPKKQNMNKKSHKRTLSLICHKLFSKLKIYLLDREDRLYHVIMKTKFNVDSVEAKDFINILLSLLLTKPPHDTSDLAFCRAYILYQKWKKIRKSEEWENMDEVVYTLYNRTAETIKTNETLRQILLPRKDSLVDVLTHINNHLVMAEEYFKFIRSENIQEFDDLVMSTLNIELDEDILPDMTLCLNRDEEDEEFEKAYNNYLKAMSSIVSEPDVIDLSNDDVKIKDSSDDECEFVGIGTRDVNPQDTETIHEICDDDDDIQEIITIKRKDTAPSKPQNQTEISTVDLTFLESIDDPSSAQPKSVESCDKSTQSVQSAPDLSQEEKSSDSGPSRNNSDTVTTVVNDTDKAPNLLEVDTAETSSSQLKNHLDVRNQEDIDKGLYGILTPPSDRHIEEHDVFPAESPMIYTKIVQHDSEVNGTDNDYTSDENMSMESNPLVILETFNENLSTCVGESTESEQAEQDPMNKSSDCDMPIVKFSDDDSKIYNEYPPLIGDDDFNYITDMPLDAEKECAPATIHHEQLPQENLQSTLQAQANTPYKQNVAVEDTGLNSLALQRPSNKPKKTVTLKEFSRFEDTLHTKWKCIKDVHEFEEVLSGPVDKIKGANGIVNPDKTFDLFNSTATITTRCLSQSSPLIGSSEVNSPAFEEGLDGFRNYFEGNAKQNASSVTSNVASVKNQNSSIEIKNSVHTPTFSKRTDVEQVRGNSPKVVISPADLLPTSTLRSPLHGILKKDKHLNCAGSIESSDRLNNCVTDGDVLNDTFASVSRAFRPRIPRKKMNLHSLNMFGVKANDPCLQGVPCVVIERLSNSEIEQWLKMSEKSRKVRLEKERAQRSLEISLLRITYDKKTPFISDRDVVDFCIPKTGNSCSVPDLIRKWKPTQNNGSRSRSSEGTDFEGASGIKTQNECNFDWPDPDLHQTMLPDGSFSKKESFNKLCNSDSSCKIDYCTNYNIKSILDDSSSERPLVTELQEFEEMKMQTSIPADLTNIKLSKFSPSPIMNCLSPQSASSSHSFMVDYTRNDLPLSENPLSSSNLNEIIDINTKLSVQKEELGEEYVSNPTPNVPLKSAKPFEYFDVIDIDNSETRRLPLKKRKFSVVDSTQGIDDDDLLGPDLVEEILKQARAEKEDSYPARPMISIAEVQEELSEPQPRIFKTPAQKKEMPAPPPSTSDAQSFLDRPKIVTEQYNNHTYNNPTINYHMNNVPYTFIPCAGFQYIPQIIFPMTSTTTFDVNLAGSQIQPTVTENYAAHKLEKKKRKEI